MKETCGCCKGLEALIPLPTANRPGLPALIYRVGTHASFLAAMKARLSNMYIEVPLEEFDEHGHQRTVRVFPLHGLTTRNGNDPSIALLDAWATVADVLTFYQERIANEGYLRSATERRSVLELARLVGYTLRPGVAATVYLAYTLETGQDATLTPGNRGQSIPGPGELPQSFETADELKARASWNTLKVRLTRPQNLTLKSLTTEKPAESKPVYVKGIATNVRVNDPILLDFGIGPAPQKLYRVTEVTPDPAADRTRVAIQPWDVSLYGRVGSPPDASLGMITGLPSPSGLASNGDKKSPGEKFKKLVESLETPASIPPANSARLPRSITEVFAGGSDIAPRLLTTLRPEIGPLLYGAWENLPVTPDPPAKVYALRTRASVFGHSAPLEPIVDDKGIITGHKEWSLRETSLREESFSISFIRSIISGSPLSLRQTTTIQINQKDPVQDVRPVPTPDSFRFNLDYPIAEETIVVTGVVTGQGTPATSPQLELTFLFAHRRIRVRIVAPLNNLAQTSFSVESLDKQTIVRETHGQAQGSPPALEITLLGEIQTTSGLETTEDPNIVWLDVAYDKILPDSWVVLDRPTALDSEGPLLIRKATQVSERSRADYGITGKSTQIQLNQDWLNLDPNKGDTFAVIRGTAVYAQSELLALTEEPIDPVQEAVAGDSIELDGLYDGLDSGRWLIITGERADIEGVSGVPVTELVMLQGVTQRFDPRLPGDKTHTVIQLSARLAYRYKRDTVAIYGNVVRATHGETRTEVLGSGDGSKALQVFPLRQSPLTYLSAPTPAGAESTLQVRVNDILWHEAESLVALKPTDRRYITHTDDEDKTTVIFGNGERGARLPTGVENIKSVYRTGIGRPGNVKAGQISLLATRPLGVKSVTNPLPATGGADRESRDRARRNAPLAVIALDRLVSVQDYEDFARTYAGIGKASARRLSDGQRQLVHLTIAGADDIPIAKHSDLYRNLVSALQQFGDPHLPVRVELRELLLIVIEAGVRLQPDYQWESVEPVIRAALLDTFGFERRELGQDVTLSEVISTIQAAKGVASVDVTTLAALDEPRILQQIVDSEAAIDSPPSAEPSASTNGRLIKSQIVRSRIHVTLAHLDPRFEGGIRPAQLAFLSPDVPDTLILSELSI